jgi:hypothetical protein
MATKPSESFTFSTDANFSSGPASGNPTKVNPAGYPSNLQGFIPGLEYAAELRNKLFNIIGQWTGWLFAGSSAGAANAHIVETDTSGNTKVRNATFTEPGGGIVSFDGGAATTLAALQVDDWPGTGVGTGDELAIVGRAGRTQTGANDNNNGGAVVLNPGAKGTGGSGTGGNGFGGTALDGPIQNLWPASGGRHHTYTEAWTLASGAAATKVMNIPGPSNKQTMVLITQLVAVQNGGGTGLAASGQRKMFVLECESGVLTVIAQQTIAEQETFSSSGPDVTVADATGDTIDVRVTGATSQSSAGILYVHAYGGKTSA